MAIEKNIWFKQFSWQAPLGSAFVVLAVLILVFTYYPLLKEEARYLVSKNKNQSVVSKAEAEKLAANGQGAEALVPVDEDFGLVIQKIGANSSVITDVDWQNEGVYQQALTKGVAHAKGTAKPGERGNMFLFAHSGVDFYQALRYNAVFYLMNKLEPGDDIDIFYQGKQFAYRVTEKQVVAPDTIDILVGNPQKETLTLMTCWPAGTTLSRLVVTAERK